MFKRLIPIILLLALFANPTLSQGLAAPAGPAIQGPDTEPQAPQAPTDTPVKLVDGFVSSFTTADPLVYWVTQPFSCSPSPDATRILRTRTTGWELRYLFNRLPVGGQPCPYRVYSNLVADSQYIFWIDSSGVVRLPVGASVYDTPETVLPAFAGVQSELAMLGEELIGISEGHIWRMSKTNPAQNYAIGYVGPDTAYKLKTDATHLYFIQTPNNVLRRMTTQGGVTNIDTNVSDYTPTGVETQCTGLTCFDYNYIYYVTSSSPTVLRRFNAVNSAYSNAYTATLPGGLTGRIYGLSAGRRQILGLPREIFFWEKRWIPCFCFETASTDYLTRLNSGVLHTRASSTAWSAEGTQTSGNFIFWKEIPGNAATGWGSVYRLAQNAATLPVVNLRWWGWEINQSIQNQDNSQFLVRNKRTFFRFFVHSDGAAVNGVTARLSAYWGGAERGSIAPLTPLINVPSYKTKTQVNLQFIFELPLDWTTHPDLQLMPVLNPLGLPLEPTYNDNRPAALLGPFEWRANPPARFHLIRVAYPGGTARDQDAIVSWLYRAYPIGIEPGQAMPTWTNYSDLSMGPLVTDFNNAKECQALDRSGKGGSDDRNMCASYFMHAQMEMMRRSNAVPTDAYLYASVAKMARGSASPTAPVANGPDVRLNGAEFALAGFYAGHEIGHLLGRAHPNAMSDDPATKNVTEGCGHSRSDPNFPNFFGWIGDGSNNNFGLDSRLNVPGGALRLMPYFGGVRDVMTYCNTPDQWVSDYTYNGLYDRLSSQPGPARPPAARLPVDLGRSQHGAVVQVDGWLNLAGLIAADGSEGFFNYVERAGDMAMAPSPIPGDYAIELRDSSGQVLSSTRFTPAVMDESPDWLAFTETVPFAAGARQIAIVRYPSGTVVFSQAISAGTPTVNVSTPAPRAPGAPGDTLPDQVDLTWTASDPDGNPLTFDVLYSPDGGASFRPVTANIAATPGGTTILVDTTSLPGGTGFFRVIASDGANTSYSDSDPVQIAVKAPVVTILSPSDGQQVQYSAPLNLSGFASDLQDGSLTGDVYQWSTQYGGLGSGQTLTANGLPTGKVTITLSATNSAGVTGSASVEITVGDELADPAPLLAAAPSAINFQAQNGSTSAMTSQVEIVNAGGGSPINWSASLTDAPWLSLDSLSGSTPYSMTLSANPSGLAASGSYSATLTVSAPGLASVNIPINLQIGPGEIWNPPAAADTTRAIYLPVINR